MYTLARRLLFALPPETSHALVFALLRAYGRLVRNPSQGAGSDPVEVAGIRFPNRIGLAAGLDKDARAVRGLAALGFGFIEVGTVTPEPQPGNPRPRLFRLEEDQAIINRMGFNNRGAEAMASRLASERDRIGVPLGVNVGKNRTTPISHAVHDYRACMTRLYGFADYLTINVSSPNTPGLRDLQSEEEANRLLRALAEHRDRLADQHQQRVPVFVKIAPDLDEAGLRAIAGVIVDSGCDGIIATNTTITRPALANVARNQDGGLSGAPLQKLALRAVRTIRAAVGTEFPIIGVGGIATAEDAFAMLDAGANLLQIYTAFIYRGPAVIQRLLASTRPPESLQTIPAGQ